MTTQPTTTEPTLAELAIEVARFLESMPDIIIGKTQREAQQLAFALRSRVSAEVAPVVDHAPIDMILFCPRCGTQHIDKAVERCEEYQPSILGVPEPQDRCVREKGHEGKHSRDAAKARWTNPPHKSHLCHQCGAVWRPADVATNGVAQISTRGRDDNTWTNSVTAPASTVAPQQSDDHVFIPPADAQCLRCGLSVLAASHNAARPVMAHAERLLPLEVEELEEVLEGANPVFRRRIMNAVRAATASASPVAPTRSVQYLVNQWQAAWLSTQDISRDSESDLVRRIEAFVSPAALRELVDGVQHRMDQVVEAAVEWHQAGREGGEWLEAAEKLGAAINSLLELRSVERCLSAEREDQKGSIK